LNTPRRFWILLSFLLIPVSLILSGQTLNSKASDLYHFSNSCFDQKKYDSAIACYRQFLQLTEHDLNNTSIEKQRIQAFLKLATSYTLISFNDSAVRILSGGLNELRKSGLDDPGTEAKFLLQTGTCFLMERDYSVALEWYRKCVNVLKGQGIVAADAFQNIANICYFKGDYENAIINYQKAWIINRNLKIKDPSRLYPILGSLGTAYIENNEPSKGMACLQSAEKMLVNSGKADSTALAGLLLNTGSAFLKMNNDRDALLNYQRGLHYLGSGHANGNNAGMVAFQGIATSYFNQAKYDSSLIYFRKALSAIPGNLTCTQNEKARVYCMIGDVYQKQPEDDSAAFYYQAAQRLILAGHQLSEVTSRACIAAGIVPAILFLVLEKNAGSLLFRGIRNKDDPMFLKQSFDLFTRAILLSDKIQQELGQEGSRLVFNESAKGVFSGAIEAGYRLWKSGLKEYEDTLIRIADCANGKIMQTELQERKAFRMKSVPDSLIRRRNFLNHEIALIAQKKLTPKNLVYDPSGDSYWNDLGKMIDLNIENDSLIQNCESRSPGFSEIRNAHPVMTSYGIQQKIAPDEVILEYFWADSALFVFAFTQESFHIQRIAPGNPIHLLVANFQRSIRQADIQKFPEYSLELYKVLVEPVRTVLNGKSSLVIIPDEELSSLPFEALISHPAGRSKQTEYPGFQYLIKDFIISYCFSLPAFIDANQKKVHRPYQFLGVAPVFRNRQNPVTSFEPLTASLEEVSRIASMFRDHQGESQILVNADATKSRFLQASGNFTHVHIATHGVLDESHPDQLGLAFAWDPAASERKAPSDLILWRQEIENLDLSADLLVLSACATGKGRLTKTEGILALPRSFHIAGASNILYTLWNVPDRQAKDFMIRFYQGFLGGKTYSSSLRTTKLQMISSPETTLPYQWAGFVLLGK